MAIYSVQLKSLSRGKGHSATAAAAYRAGLALDDPTTGELHDYTRRAGVMSLDMLAPAGAPEWARDAHKLWALVEQSETRKNARVGREIVLALPHELTAEARRALACAIGQLLVDRYAVAVQVAIHAPDRGGDARNFHAHILFTPRQVRPEGFGDHAARVLDEFPGGAAEIRALRSAIADHTNDALKRGGSVSRVDSRKLEEQKLEAAKRGNFEVASRLDRLPTRHEGKATTQARRRGERTPRAQRNDRRKVANGSRQQALADRFRELKAMARAEGRLPDIDEQALHAQALLDVAGGRRRTSKVAASTVRRPTPNPRRRTESASAARPTRATLNRVAGNGTKESEREAQLLNQWLASLDDAVAALIRQALTWGQAHRDTHPRDLARRCARSIQQAHVSAVAHEHLAEQLNAAKAQRRELEKRLASWPSGLGAFSRAAAALGWTPQKVREIRQDIDESRALVAIAKRAERRAAETRREMQETAERERQSLLQAYQAALEEEGPTLPSRQHPEEPSSELRGPWTNPRRAGAKRLRR